MMHVCLLGLAMNPIRLRLISSMLLVALYLAYTLHDIVTTFPLPSTYFS